VIELFVSVRLKTNLRRDE